MTTLGDITGFNGLGQGNFTLYMIVTDTAGNAYGTASEAGIVKDTGAPTGTVRVDSDPINSGYLQEVRTLTYD